MKKVLIVDDDTHIRTIFTKILKRNGYDVVAAETGIHALEIMLEHQFDLVVLDIKMPDIHGLEVLSLIREAGNDVPVIICSAFEGMKEDFIIKSSTISDYLVKPIDLATFTSSVKKAIGTAL